MPANIARWLRRRHDRVALMRLDDRQLADLGISRGEIDCAITGSLDRIR